MAFYSAFSFSAIYAVWRIDLGVLHVVGARFIAPVSGSDSVPAWRIGWGNGRHECGPYNVAFSPSESIGKHSLVILSKRINDDRSPVHAVVCHRLRGHGGNC